MNNIKRSEFWKDFIRPVWRKNEIFKISRYGTVISSKFNPDGEKQKIYLLGGYETFSCIKKNGKTDLVYIHRAVAEVFLKKVPGKPFVIHKDYNKTNNDVTNLKYADRKEITAHHMKNPAVIRSKKESILNPKYSKLNVGKVKIIKRKLFDPNRKTRMRLIAKQFGISEMQLYRIKSGENWGHITDY